MMISMMSMQMFAMQQQMFQQQIQMQMTAMEKRAETSEKYLCRIARKSDMANVRGVVMMMKTAALMRMSR
jgi:hypothetical protein